MGSEVFLPLAAILIGAGITFIVAGFEWNTEEYPDTVDKELDELLGKIDDALFSTSQVVAGNIIKAIRQRKKKMPEEEYQAILSDAYIDIKNNVISYYWEPESPLRLCLEQKTSVSNLRIWESRFANSLCYLGAILVISAIPLIIFSFVNVALSYEWDVITLTLFLNLIFICALYLALSRVKCRRLKKTISSGMSNCRTRLEKLRKGGAK